MRWEKINKDKQNKDKQKFQVMKKLYLSISALKRVITIVARFFCLLQLCFPRQYLLCLREPKSCLGHQFCSDSAPITSNMSVNKNISWTYWVWVAGCYQSIGLCKQLLVNATIWIDCNNKLDPHTQFCHCWQFFCISFPNVYFQWWVWTM